VGVNAVAIRTLLLPKQKIFLIKGYREVTLLGQNVDSYKWSEEENNKARLEKKGILMALSILPTY
jgi:tRNA A37 methylthiotransferase MiaB